MILKENNNQEIIIGNSQEKEFSVDSSNSVIFEILRNKMYSNKIGAIAREVASNSRDANREAKSDKPIAIEFTNNNILSTIGDTSIIFKDFGIGISPERMDDVFLKYGASTKRDSNLQTGGFGLGAKTPFAYTDSFIIKTVSGGVEYIYNAIIDASGKGKMILLSEDATDSHSGTEIIIPILSNENRQRFEKEVYIATGYWDNVEYVNFSIPKPDNNVILEGENFKVVKYNKSPFIGLLDGIPYELELNKPDIEDFTVIFNLELDKVTINANRESLQYDEITESYVDALYEKFKIELQEILNEELSYEEDFPQAYSRFLNIKNGVTSNDIDEIINSLSNYSHNGFDTTVKYQGENVSKIKLKSHIVLEVSRGKKGFSYTNSDLNFELPLIYFDKGKINLGKNDKLGNFILIKPNKDVHEDSIQEEKKYLESLGFSIDNYSNIKLDKEYVRPSNSKVKIYIRSGYYGNYKSHQYFDKILKVLDKYSPEDTVLEVVHSFSRGSMYTSDNKVNLIKYDKGIKNLIFVNRASYKNYLKGAGFKTVGEVFSEINLKKFHKYSEISNIKRTLENVPKVILDNFEELLPKSILEFKSMNIKSIPEELVNLSWSSLGIKESKFDYDGAVSKMWSKIEQNYPLLRSYIKCNSADELIKINNIKKYIKQC